MANSLPINMSKIGSMVMLLHLFTISKFFNEEFQINVDDSNRKHLGADCLAELSYWGIHPDKIQYLSRTPASQIEYILNNVFKRNIYSRKVNIITCDCGRLELYGRDLEEGIYGESKVFENGKCALCNTVKEIQKDQLILITTSPLQQNTGIYPKNMSKFFSSKFPGLIKKEIRISRVRITPFDISWQNKHYYLDPDFVSYITLGIHDSNFSQNILFSQKRPEKLFLMNALSNKNTNLIGIPYLENFQIYYNKIKSSSNKYTDLIVFLALSTSWKKQQNKCYPEIFKMFKKLSEKEKASLINKINEADSIESFIKIFNNNLLSLKQK